MRSIEPHDPAITYASVLDALPIAAYLARPDGSIAYLSPGWETVTGIDPSMVLGNEYPSIIHPEQRDRAVQTWLFAHAAQTAYHDELQLRFGDGSYRWVSSEAKPMRDPASGQVVGWFGTVADIDDSKRAQETLRAQAEFNERLIASSDDCITTLDLDARLVSMSANGQILLGIMDVNALLGTSWLHFWHGEERVAARRAIEAALRGQTGRFSGSFPVENEPRWFDVAVTAILDAKGNAEKLLAIARDITVQRNSSEALEESARRYRAITEALPGVAWSASPQGELDFVSDQISDVHGRDEQSVLGDHWIDVLHPDDREAARQRWEASVTTGSAYETKFRVAMPDGHIAGNSFVAYPSEMRRARSRVGSGSASTSTTNNAPMNLARCSLRSPKRAAT